MKIRFATLAAACLLSGCGGQSASTNPTAKDEVWLLPWGLAKFEVGSSKENTRSASTNSTAEAASTNSTAEDRGWVVLGRSLKKDNAIRHYVRTDGQPIDPDQTRAVLAQCQSEGARSAYPWEYTNACMAHNGYVAQ
jgi:hypothetical protein